MADSIEGLILLAVVGLLVVLRFDARRFSAAEYDDEEAPGGWRTWARRLSWYGFGLLLIVIVYFLSPQPLTVLHLQMGNPRTTALFYGLALGGLGAISAFGYAWWRFADLRLPPAHRYPAGVLNSIGTAFIDEATFRGIILGLLLMSHWPVELAIGFQAVLYALATRLAGRGRSLGMLAFTVVIGLAGGWVTVVTGGIGGAFLGHAITRFAIFIATGHAGQIRASAEADEEDTLDQTAADTPRGWEVVTDTREPGGPRDTRW